MNKIHNNLTVENLIKTEDFKQLTIKERKELITSSQWFNQFDKKQQEEILDGACYNLDISIYAKSEFDHYQMDEIKRGLKKGLDVSVYAKTEFNWKQIKEGLQDNLDVLFYANSKYNDRQMEVIKVGLEEGLDVSVYANEVFNEKQMKAILFCLKENLKLKLSSNENEILILE